MTRCDASLDPWKACKESDTDSHLDHDLGIKLYLRHR